MRKYVCCAPTERNIEKIKTALIIFYIDNGPVIISYNCHEETEDNHK